MRLGALAQRLGVLLAHESAKRACAIGPSVVAWSSGLPTTYFFVEVDEAVDEVVIDLLVHIDALDAAAALAGIEEGAVDQVRDRVVELGVGQHIGRVLAAELQAERREGAGRRLLDRAAAGDRAGEVDVVDLAGADQLLGLRVVQDEVLEHALRQAGRVEAPGEALADQQRLRGVLEDAPRCRPSAPARSC